MNIEYIQEQLRKRVPKPIEEMAEFAVLIPLIYNKGQWEVIYELRAKGMKSQPGEVSFPGGSLEDDETFQEAAIRETIEELNIEEKNINVVGELDYLLSYSNLEIHCFLATINGVVLDEIKPNPAEVDHVFTIPLDYLLNNEPRAYSLEVGTMYNEEFPYNLIPCGEKYSFRKYKRSIYFYEYTDYIVWGFTASMTKHLSELLKGLEVLK